MEPASIPMPGALRLRALHPLIGGGGSCSLLYDLERALVLEVPEELQFHVAPALETGDPDEDLVSWLLREDLLTGQRYGAEGAGWPGAGGLLQAGDETSAWIDQPAEAAAMQAVGRLFDDGLNCNRLKLHLDWAGRVPGNGLLERVVAEARRRAAAAGQEISFELALDAAGVTPLVAASLAAELALSGSLELAAPLSRPAADLAVRLRCGTVHPPGKPAAAHEKRPWLAAEPAVRLLLDRFGERLTLQCVLGGPARLLELWGWAKGIGLRHLDVIRLEEIEPPDRISPLSRLRELRNDLLELCEESCAELEAGGLPVNYQPLTRIVRRLLRGEAPLFSTLPSLRRADGESVDPRLELDSDWRRAEPLELAAEPGEIAEAFESETGPPCQGCWARQLCSHSDFPAAPEARRSPAGRPLRHWRHWGHLRHWRQAPLAAAAPDAPRSPIAGEDSRAPTPELCGFWSTEVEVALRLYHRMMQIDTLQVLRFLDAAAVPPPLQRAGTPQLAGAPSLFPGFGGWALKPA
ncbi:MAG TPA: hypothetical protein VHR45_13955 [Thermoanaerobaculia bacterium]|nr:hypothetical protein [Thermoanaerobaculia bacterium]